ncbi:hypothetical protein [Fundidesulfovibrio putealis]|uniref:hypothetical protein n=1 Tax=Fundidesulfovibrio putealis TaxID=270496 RepID=UPI00040EA2C6|nr:hypothetical protein [Fundidesulfovibrio putealis]
MPYPTQAGSTETGFAEEQARKRQLYEDALDRFAGFEPGESQLSDEQIMARRAARQQSGVSAGFSRQQPSAQFAQRGVNDIPFDTLLAHLKAQPGMVEHLEGIDLDGDGIPDIPPQPSPQMMAHPMGRMQWQAMLQNHQQARQARRAQRKAVNNEMLLAYLRTHDPLFGVVHAKVEAYVKALPLKLQRPVLRAVDETPGAYIDLYKEMRDMVTATMRIGGRRSQQAGGRIGDGHGPGRLVRQGAPQLESAGMIDERSPGATRAAERAALVKRVKAGGAREGDLLKYLELSGL